MVAPPITLDGTIRYGSPLYRCINDEPDPAKGLTKTKYLVAYRDVTLIPFNASLHNVPTSPVENSVALHLAEGPDAAQNIEIYAENVHIYLGSLFDFHSKNLTIHCRKLQLVTNGNATKATLDCSGITPDNNFVPHGNGPNGDQTSFTYEQARFSRVPGTVWMGVHGPDSWTVDFPGQWTPAEFKPSDGQNGINGDNGKSGTNGGNIRIITGSFEQPPKPTASSPLDNVTLVMSVEGGRGAIGQDGTAGGNQGGVKYAMSDVETYQKQFEQAKQQPGTNQPFNGPPVCQAPQAIFASRTKYAFLQPIPKAGNGGNGGDAGSNGIRGSVVTSSQELDGMADSFVMHDAIEKALQNKTVKGGKAGAGGSKFDGDPNNSGTKGSDGADGKSQDYQDTSYSPKTGTEAGRKVMRNEVAFADPLYIMMLIQRLLFEYQMLFDSRMEKDVNAKVISEYIDSVSWVQRLMEGKLIDEKSRFNTDDQRIVSQCTSMYRQLLQSNISAVDLYNNAFNYVPTAAIRLSLIHSKVEQLRIAEEALLQIADALAQTKVEKQKVLADFRRLESQVVDDTKALKETESALDELGHKIDSAVLDLQSQRQKISSNMNDVWYAAKEELKPTCDGWEAVLSALSSVLMFLPHGQPGVAGPAANTAVGAIAGAAGSGFPATYAIGALVSLGSSLGQISTDANDSKTRADLIERRIFDISDAVDDTALPQAIGKANAEVLALRKGDSKLLSRIAVAKNRFESMCDNYFIGTKIKKVKEVRGQFDAYMDTAELFNNLITEYNRAVIRYQKIRLDQVTAKEGKDVLEGANDSIQSAEYDILSNYFQQVATFQRTEALESLYEGVRAYNCASLSFSTAFPRLAPLGSFANIDSTTLGSVVNTYFQDEIQKFSKTAANLDHYKDRIVKLLGNEHKAGFDLFKKSGIFTWTFEVDAGAKYFDKSWYDIRLSDFRLILVGATAKKSHAVNDVVDINVQLGSSFLYLDQPASNKDVSKRVHEYIYDSIPTTVSYKYKNASSTDFKSYSFTSRQEDKLKQFDFNPALDTSDSSRYTMPLVSPFTKWRFQVDLEKIDLSKLKEIHLSLEGRMRTPRITVASTPVKAMQPHELVHEKSLVHSALPPVRVVVLVNPKFWKNLPIFRVNVRARTPPSLPTHVEQTLGASGVAMARYFGENPEVTAAEYFSKSFGNNNLISAKLLADHSIPSRQLSATLDVMETRTRSLNRPYFEKGNNGPGHAYLAGLKLSLTSEQMADIKDKPYAFLYRWLTALPNPYVLVLDKGDSKLFEQAKDPNAWVATNYDRLKKRHDEMIKNNEDCSGCYVRLAKGSWVHVGEAEVVRDGTQTRVMSRLVTTEWHNVDGTAIWSGRFDEADPLVISMTQTGVGEAKGWGVDFVNYFLGKNYFELQQRLLPYAIDAMRKDITMVEHVAKTSTELLDKIMRWVHLDANLGLVLSLYRQWTGPNIAWKKTISDITSQIEKGPIKSVLTVDSKTPTTKAESGFHIKDVPISSSSLIFQTPYESSLNPAQQADLSSRLEKEMHSNINPQELKSFRESIQDAASQWLITIQNLHEKDDLPGTVPETTAEIMYHTGFREVAESKFKSFISYDQLVANLKDEILKEVRTNPRSPSAALYKGMDKKTLEKVLIESAYDGIIRPYHAPDGLLEATTKHIVTDSLVNTLSSFGAANNVVNSGIDALINSAAAAQQKTQNNLANARNELKDPSKTKEEREKLEREIAEMEVKEKVQEGELERGKELKDVREKGEEKRKAAGDAMDKAEKDFMERKGEHGDGHGEHGGGAEHGEGR
ncbi:MAG: hypothetical protein Q9227_006844 [Pyrenula ochraceoflavens]